MIKKLIHLAVTSCVLALFSQVAAAAQTVLQAENANGNVVFENIHGGYTGTGYVNTPNQQGVNLLFLMYSSVEPAVPGTIKIRYANGGNVNRPATFYVNTDMFTLQFPPTGGWNVWKDVSVSSPIIWSGNEFLLEATSNQGLANIDKITVVTP